MDEAVNQLNRVCCICKKPFIGWGNNPYGALNESYEPITWKPTAQCCEDCNKKYVIPGRLYLSKHQDNNK